MEHPWEVVVVSSNLRNRQDVAAMLFRLGIDPICVSSVDQIPIQRNIRLVFCDRQMKDGDYRDVLSAIAAAKPDSKVVLMSDLGSSGEYQEAKRLGLFDVIPSPCRARDIEWMVIQARRQTRQTKLLDSREPTLHKIARGAG